MVQRFYFPLTVDTCKRYYDLDDESYGYKEDVGDGRIAYEYRGYIENAFDKFNDGDYDMAQYFDDYYSKTANAKMVGAEWHFVAVNKCLYGRVDIFLTEPLTAEETEIVKDWITGQNSDGLGEGFEQQEIKTHDDNLISVSFWNTSDDYSIMTEEEFKKQ